MRCKKETTHSLVSTHDYIIWQRSLIIIRATHIDQASLALRQVKTLLLPLMPAICVLATMTSLKSSVQLQPSSNCMLDRLGVAKTRLSLGTELHSAMLYPSS